MFLIRHRFSTPWTVKVRKKRVELWKGEERKATFIAETGFVGKSAQLGERFGAKVDVGLNGNTIIFKLQGSESWIFVGKKVERFTPMAKIVNYFSPLTREDVAQPWAIDELGNCYLFREKAILDGRKTFDSAYDAIRYYSGHNPYDDFYARRTIVGPQQKHQTVKSIWLGAERLHVLKWQADPIKHYKELKSDFENLFVIHRGQEEQGAKSLSLEEYELLNAVAGSERGFKPLSLVVLHE